MRQVAIRAQNLSKRYSLGARRELNDPMLRDAITGLAGAPLRWLTRVGRALAGADGATTEDSTPHTWALHGVSFEIERGEIVGIIGPNGAGKSTLLKVLSRITEPTGGRAEIHGRIGSMLEVGTGFHPELTGRENIYLSGAMLGMKKTDIDRRLDEIIAFSGVEKFIETPVKHYSSGMYVRLGFAVAAHLESEILLVDEVLAVGDAGFQRKCMAKMEEIRQQGRTILLVSHNMSALSRLSDRAIFIADGAIQKEGPAAEVVSAYLLMSLSSSPERAWLDPAGAPGDGRVRLRRLRIRTQDGVTAETLDIHHPIGLEMLYEVLEPGGLLTPYFEVSDASGLCLFGTQDLTAESRGVPRSVGRFTSTAWIPANFLSEGLHFVRARLFCPDPVAIHCDVSNAIAFHVVDRTDGEGARGDWVGPIAGVIRPRLDWTTRPASP